MAFSLTHQSLKFQALGILTKPKKTTPCLIFYALQRFIWKL